LEKISLIVFGVVLTLLIALDVSGLTVKNKDLDLYVVDALERQAYDFRVRMTGSLKQDSRIVIIDVGEESLARVGQWPWSREVIAKLTSNLFEKYGVDTLGFDVVFAEPELDFTEDQISRAFNQVQSGEELSISEALKGQSGDVKFTESIRGNSVVLGYLFDNEETSSVGVLPEPLFTEQDYNNKNIYKETSAPIAKRYTANLAYLQEASGKAGYFSLDGLIDPDGIIRRAGLINRFNDRLYPSFSLQLALSYLKSKTKPKPVLINDSDFKAERLEGIDLLHGKLDLDAEGAAFVPYSMSENAYKYIPAWKVVEGSLKQDISQTIAIVGTSASGLVDLRSTPIRPSFPGVEVHANMLTAILDKSFRTNPVWARVADAIIILILGFALAFLLPYLSALKGSIVFVATTLGIIGFNLYMWQSLIILSIAPVLLLLFSIYIVNMVVGFFAESRSRAVMKSMFGLYVPPEVVSEMSKNTDIYSLKSSKREMTPDDLSELLNEFLSEMTEIIHKHGGAVDKYIGDAIMAFWGAPLPSETHAEDAVSASLEMVERLKEMNVKFKEKGWPELRIGVGISSGMVSVGNMGSKFRMAYTVMGDTVNVASRIEDLTKKYQVEVIASEYTKRMAPQLKYRQLDTLKVKGRDMPVTIYECL